MLINQCGVSDRSRKLVKFLARKLFYKMRTSDPEKEIRSRRIHLLLPMMAMIIVDRNDFVKLSPGAPFEICLWCTVHNQCAQQNLSTQFRWLRQIQFSFNVFWCSDVSMFRCSDVSDVNRPRSIFQIQFPSFCNNWPSNLIQTLLHY